MDQKHEVPFMRPRLIRLVNDIRSRCSEVKIALPQIVVIGETSTGKSTLLTAMSNVQFPTGQLICTRCPIELQLRHDPNITRFSVTAGGETKSFETMGAEFQHQLEVAHQTVIQTLVADQTVNTRETIVVGASGPTQPDLTLIDLPGLAQGRAAKDEIQLLVRGYAEQKNTIILAAVDASRDLSNQPQLTIARECDPTGKRTFAVLTKADGVTDNKVVMDSLFSLAQNQDSDFEVALGWGVTAAISTPDDETKTLDEAWAPLRTSKNIYLGRQRVRAKLASLLQTQVCEQLPIVMETVQRRLLTVTQILANIGPLTTPEVKRNRYMEIHQRIADLVKKSTHADHSELFFHGGDTNRWENQSVTKFRVPFSECVQRRTREEIANITIEDLEGRYRSAQGSGLEGFMSPQLFQNIFSDLIISPIWKEEAKRATSGIVNLGKHIRSNIIDEALKEESGTIRKRLKAHMEQKFSTIFMQEEKKCDVGVLKCLAKQKWIMAPATQEQVYKRFLGLRYSSLMELFRTAEQEQKQMTPAKVLQQVLFQEHSKHASWHTANDTKNMLTAYQEQATQQFINDIAMEWKDFLGEISNAADTAWKNSVHVDRSVLESLFRIDAATTHRYEQNVHQRNILEGILREMQDVYSDF